MNKREIVTEIASRSGIKIDLAANVMDSVLDTLFVALAEGDDITLREFGTFKIVKKKERKGRNPKTGETIQIPGRNVIKFIPNKALANAVREQSLTNV